MLSSALLLDRHARIQLGLRSHRYYLVKPFDAPQVPLHRSRSHLEMKAKACTRCRQWKTRCDAPERVPGGCSRCRSLGLTCVFDPSFKRLSKGRCVQQMSAEIQQLRQTLANSGASNASASPQSGQDTIGRPLEPVSWEAQLSGTSDGTGSSPAQFSTSLSVNTIPIPSGPLTDQDRTLGNVCLTRSQVERHFKTYFTRHHRYLPFKVSSESPEEVYMRSSLLFWVICAVTSSWKQQTQLSPMIKPMIAASIHMSSYSVETIQALLIMCIWPFKAARLSEDPSQFYSSIATQMSLQLGLHRPSQPYWPLQHGSLSGPLTAADKDVRLTTWLSCYLVNQMQSSAQGVPPSILVDSNLLDAFDNPAVDRDLSQLCHT